MIRLDVKDYCELCLEFDADVVKPERYVSYDNAGDETLVFQSDTIIHCKHAKRCESMMRYLTQKTKGDK